MAIIHTHVCSKGHEQPGFPVEYGHVVECHTCGEVCVKVYPQGGGREWVVLPPSTVRFHRLIAEDHEEGLGNEGR